MVLALLRPTFQLSPNEAQPLVSEGMSTMGVLKLASDQPISIVAGPASGAKTAEGDNQPGKDFSPLLPHSMLGRTHVILMPYGSRSSKIKVTSVSGKTKIEVWFTSGTYLEVMLDSESHTWSHDQTDDLVIQSDQPVTVVQVLDKDEKGTEIKPVAPTSHWRKFYEVGSQNQQDANINVSIIIRTRQIPGLLGTSIKSMNDVTPGLKWRKIGQTQFSLSSLEIDARDTIQFRHFDPDVAFHVIETDLGTQRSSMFETNTAQQCPEISTQAQAADVEPANEELPLLHAQETETGKAKSRQKRSFGRPLPFAVSQQSSSPLPLVTINNSAVLNFLLSNNISVTHLGANSGLVINLSNLSAVTVTNPTWLSSSPSTFSSTMSSTVSSTAAVGAAAAAVTNSSATTESSDSDSGTNTALIAGAGAGAAAAVGAGAAVAAVVAVKLSAAAAVAPGAAYAAAAGTGQAAATVAGSGYTTAAGAAGNGVSSMAGSGQTMSAFHSGPAIANNVPPPGTTMVNVGPV
ncbi:hypothetical protein PoB_006027800 [Plakobranchus ocellatus]|uniref:Uncharacterized protein n=1 Tax=Plakobranchus ocellatus TaxID=259542 RepID=A0AAV4CPF0_9GAST|nr:hypothetical protein PoB_006027800 [Plakobranchus ocellatus]